MNWSKESYFIYVCHTIALFLDLIQHNKLFFSNVVFLFFQVSLLMDTNFVLIAQKIING